MSTEREVIEERQKFRDVVAAKLAAHHRKRDIMRECIEVMIESENWRACANLLIEQLGPEDALFSVER